MKGGRFIKLLSAFLQLFDTSDTDPVINEKEYEELMQELIVEYEQPVKTTLILLPDETKLIKEIRAETAKYNRNNLTRTEAYLTFYTKYPEIHWALLAHLVSRNGGYHMTDLKGDLLDHIFEEADRQTFFSFLEGANAAIFADAYPQLLLYSYALKQQLDLRKFLSIFHVSRFMYPIWEQFIRTKQSPLLTNAMIINEQRMLEDRLIKRTTQGNLLKRLDFQLQEYLGFTLVLIPYQQKKNALTSVTGLKVERFADPVNRILIGKKLYGLLFQDENVLKGCLKFSYDVPHTGSRSDYWSGVFSKKKRNRLYSPALEDVWSDVPLAYLPKTDWYVNVEYSTDLQFYPKLKKADLTKQAFDTIMMLQLINKTNDLGSNLLPR